MDIVLHNEAPSAAERDAVDAVLGPPASSWEGATERSARDERVARGGHAARARRHLLLPTLHAVQARAGWISRGALNYICQRLTIPPAEAYGVATFYALFSLEPQPPVVAHVCTDVACIARGSADLVADLERTVGPEGEHPGNGQAIWLESPCLGVCERAPAVMVTEAGDVPRERTVAPARAPDIASMLSGGDAPPEPPPSVPQAGDPSLRLLRRVGVVDPNKLDSYRAHGGYEALRAAFDMGPDGVLREVERREAPRPRRRGVPDRPQVGGRRAQRQAPALPHLQRRRVRAGHVQGPRHPRERPVLHRRGDDDRGLRDRLRARLPVPPRRVPARVGAPRRRGHRGAGPRLPRRQHPRPGHPVRHRVAQGRRARTSAARRPRSSTRSRATAASRATSRRSRSTSGCSTSRRSSTTSRRSSTSPASSSTAGRPTRRSAPRTRRARACSA